MKKLISIILLASLLAGLASCGSESVNQTETSENDTSPAAESTSAPAISPELPDVDYGGYEFRILSSNEVGSIRYSAELYAEEETGEPLNDAVFRRNRMVEEAFGVKISSIEVDPGQPVQMFRSSVMAGDNSYDVLVDVFDSIMTIGYEYGAEISDLPYVDIDRDWWDGEVIREAAIGGKAFGLLGDINIVDNKATWCLLFNKSIAERYDGIGDLYDTVRQGKWTIDEMTRCCKLVSHDLNGDGVMDHNDQWGMLASGNVAASFIWSCGGGFGRTNGKGEIELTIDSERNLNALDKAYDFFALHDVVLDINKIPSGVNGMSNWEYQRSIFREGRSLFIGGVVAFTDYFRDMEDEFGILPLPKYDEEQSDYICTAQEWCATMFLVPRTAPDLTRTSVILEAMASASVSTITPAYYELSLERKIARDRESGEMLDIIFSSRVFDAAYTYNWGNVRSLANLLTSGSNTLASSIASIKTSAEAAKDAYIKGLE